MFCTLFTSVANIYLPCGPLLVSSSLTKVPLPIFGFLARGVYHVPPFSFPKKLVSLALYKYFYHQEVISSPLDFSTLGYFFPKHEHYNHLRLCEHGLSSIVIKTTAFVFRIIIHLFHIPFFQVVQDVS